MQPSVCNQPQETSIPDSISAAQQYLRYQRDHAGLSSIAKLTAIAHAGQEILREVCRLSQHYLLIFHIRLRSGLQNVLQTPLHESADVPANSKRQSFKRIEKHSPQLSDAIVHRRDSVLGTLTKDFSEVIFDLVPGLIANDASVHDEESLFFSVGRSRGSCCSDCAFFDPTSTRRRNPARRLATTQIA